MIESVKRALRRLVTPRHAAVLAYHSALEQPAPFSIWQHMEKQQLESQLAWLSRHCQCISVSELMAGLASKQLPKNAVAITFDDGFANNLHVVLPMLEKYRIPATFFIVAGFIDSGRLMWPEVVACILSATRRSSIQFDGKQFLIGSVAEKTAAYKVLARYMKLTLPAQLQAELRALADAAEVTEESMLAQPLAHQVRMMSWQELQTLASSELVEIGAHTINHHPLSAISDAEVEFEMTSAKKLLEQKIGAVRYFAYPYGGPQDYHPHHRQIIVDAGYQAAFTTDPECVVRDTQPFSIPRLGVGNEASLSSVAYQVGGGLAMQRVRARH